MNLFFIPKPTLQRAKLFGCLLGLSAILISCGGGGDGNTTVSVASYNVSGTVNGLVTGQSVTLAEASGASTTLSANGNYTLVLTKPSAATYSLFVAAQPSGQICNIGNSSGSLSEAGVSNVAVSCVNGLNLLAGDVGGAGDADGVGVSAAFRELRGIAIDAVGNLYVTDIANYNIRKISPAGVVSAIAGASGIRGYADGTTTTARFNLPNAIATDAQGNVYVADTLNQVIRKISPAGVVSTLAGTTTFVNPAGVEGGFADGRGSEARFNYPYGIAVDLTGAVYVADTFNNRIRKISPTGMVSTFAGTTTAGFTDGTGTAASFGAPRELAIDAAGNLYVKDELFNRGTGNISYAIRKISPAGNVSTIKVSETPFAAGTPEAAFFNIVDATGNVYELQSTAIRKVSPAGVISAFVGSESKLGYADAVGAEARFSAPLGLANDTAGNLYVADGFNFAVRKINSAGVVSTFAGAQLVDTPNGTISFRISPSNLAVDTTGNVYASQAFRTILKISPAGAVSTFATTQGSINIRLEYPIGLATDIAGNVYAADAQANTIYKISPAGEMSTFAGTATSGFVDGAGTAARFCYPRSVAVDVAGNVYVVDSGNNAIRKISPAGIVNTIAGSITGGCHDQGYTENSGFIDGTGTAARFNQPRDLVVDATGNVYVADFGNHTIRKISPSGVVSTVVGRVGSAGVLLSTLPGSLKNPIGLALSGGKLFITTNNGVVWTYAP